MINFTFPIFKIREHLAYKEEYNISYIKDTMGNWKILDNKNLTGDSLASRRLRILENKYNLSNAIITFSQLLKHHKYGDRYIDTNGLCFIYKKTTRVPLKYYKIRDAIYASGYGIVLTIIGVSIPIVIPAGCNIEGYIGLLEYNGGYLLYDMPRPNKKEDTWRKI